MENTLTKIAAIATIIGVIIAAVIFLTGYASLPEILNRGSNSQTNPSTATTVTPTPTPSATTPTAIEHTTTATPPAKTDVTITSPANNAPVSMHEWVKGTSQNIPAGQHLWILVQVNSLYYAHEVVTINAHGQWEHYTQIGQDNNTRDSFILIAALANDSAHDALQIWRNSQNTKNQYDLDSLPQGIDQYSTIIVTRK